MNNNFFVKIDLPVEGVGENFNSKFPDIKVPFRVNEENDNYLLFGYFVSYEDWLSEENLLSEIENNGFKKLVNSNSEFLLFLFDKKKNTLSVLVDQFFSFACYFSCLQNSIIFSSSFSSLKNEVKKEQKLIGDLDGVMTGLLWSWHMTEKTLVKQIKVIPAGCILEIDLNNPKNNKITSYVDVDGFLSSAGNFTFDSMSDFASVWLEAVMEVVRERWEAIPKGVNVACDISSGFDCTLVAYCLSKIAGPEAFTCYSQYSGLVEDETNKKVMKKFLEKHGIKKFKAIDTTERHLFNSDFSKEWSLDDPYQIASDRQQMFLSLLKDDGVQVEFTGEGGDEVYRLKGMELFLMFGKQQNYFLEVSNLKKYGIQALFTPNGINMFLDWSRFNKRKFYPMIVSESNVVGASGSYEEYNAHGLRLTHPFLDTRLMALGKQMPEIPGKKKWELKLELMKELKHVFVEEMFIPVKGGMEEMYANFARNQRVLIESVLKNSILSEAGMIDPKCLNEMLDNENSEIYTNSNVAIALETLVKLEWFLQKNEIETLR